MISFDIYSGIWWGQVWLKGEKLTFIGPDFEGEGGVGGAKKIEICQVIFFSVLIQEQKISSFKFCGGIFFWGDNKFVETF